MQVITTDIAKFQMYLRFFLEFLANRLVSNIDTFVCEPDTSVSAA